MKTPEQIADSLVTPERYAQISTPADLRRLIGAGIAADRAQRAEASAYKVGDPDPTPDVKGEGYCDEVGPDGDYVCTWHVGHGADLPHVAGTGERIAAVWS